jgi:muconolactone delta-isomerase
VAEDCFDITVHQWKLSHKIELFAKWNLISLPFRPFETDITTALTSFPNAGMVMSIWHYDQCADDWFGYSGEGLTEMVDGDGYWIRMPYGPTAPIGTSYGDWWVFGTDRPYEEAPTPFSYTECEGWSMIGFTPVWVAGVPQATGDMNYLWNWWDIFGTWADYGLIYGWTPATQTWAVHMPSFGTFVPGEGYWISFEHDGFVYP